MSYIERHSVVVTTIADGSATAYSDHIDFGFLNQIRYVKTDFDNGSTFTITLNGTGESLLTETGINADATRAPRQPLHSLVGAALGATIVDKIAIVNDKIKIVIAGGGNVKTGTFYFLVS